eukprot:6515513-Prymnesium_polylepis.1
MPLTPRSPRKDNATGSSARPLIALRPNDVRRLFNRTGPRSQMAVGPIGLAAVRPTGVRLHIPDARRRPRVLVARSKS